MGDYRGMIQATLAGGRISLSVRLILGAGSPAPFAIAHHLEIVTIATALYAGLLHHALNVILLAVRAEILIVPGTLRVHQ